MEVVVKQGLARRSRDAKQARRLMALGGIADGLSRADAAAALSCMDAPGIARENLT